MKESFLSAILIKTAQIDVSKKEHQEFTKLSKPIEIN